MKADYCNTNKNGLYISEICNDTLPNTLYISAQCNDTLENTPYLCLDKSKVPFIIDASNCTDTV